MIWPVGSCCSVFAVSGMLQISCSKNFAHSSAFWSFGIRLPSLVLSAYVCGVYCFLRFLMVAHQSLESLLLLRCQSRLFLFVNSPLHSDLFGEFLFFLVVSFVGGLLSGYD